MKRPTEADVKSYFLRYSDLPPEGDIVETLSRQCESTTALLAEIDEDQADQRYAPDKWSIKELVGHVVDTERIFAYRLMSIARGEAQSLPGFEQDDYVTCARFGARTLASLREEFRAQRQSNLALFASLDAEAQDRMGTVDGGPMRVSSIPWIVAGHELHHERVLRKRYLA